MRGVDGGDPVFHPENLLGPGAGASTVGILNDALTPRLWVRWAIRHSLTITLAGRRGWYCLVPVCRDAGCGRICGRPDRPQNAWGAECSAPRDNIIKTSR